MSEIKDVSLAPSGERKIDWVARNMPVLSGIAADFEPLGREGVGKAGRVDADKEPWAELVE